MQDDLVISMLAVAGSGSATGKFGCKDSGSGSAVAVAGSDQIPWAGVMECTAALKSNLNLINRTSFSNV